MIRMIPDGAAAGMDTSGKYQMPMRKVFAFMMTTTTANGIFSPIPVTIHAGEWRLK
jgi:hypothetical protein